MKKEKKEIKKLKEGDEVLFTLSGRPIIEKVTVESIDKKGGFAMLLILRVQTPVLLIMLQQVSCSVLNMTIWKNTLQALLSVAMLLHVFIRITAGAISGLSV